MIKWKAAAEEAIDAMPAAVDNLDVQFRGCSFIASLAAYNAAELLKEEAAENVIAAMTAHPNEASLQEQCCAALGGLAADTLCQKSLLDIGALDIIFRVMLSHRDHLSLQISAITALSRLLWTEHESEVAQAEEICGHIISVMQEHSDSVDLHRCGCGVLGALASKTSSSKLLELVIHQVKRSLVIAGLDGVVTLEAFNAIAYAAFVGGPSTTEQLNAEGVGELILFGIDAHYDNPFLCERAAFAYAGLISNTPSPAGILLSEHACDVLLRLLGVRGASLQMKASVCEIIVNSCETIDGKLAFHRAGAVNAIIELLSRSLLSDNLVTWTCMAIRAMGLVVHSGENLARRKQQLSAALHHVASAHDGEAYQNAVAKTREYFSLTAVEQPQQDQPATKEAVNEGTQGATTTASAEDSAGSPAPGGSDDAAPASAGKMMKVEEEEGTGEDGLRVDAQTPDPPAPKRARLDGVGHDTAPNPYDQAIAAVATRLGLRATDREARWKLSEKKVSSYAKSFVENWQAIEEAWFEPTALVHELAKMLFLLSRPDNAVPEVGLKAIKVLALDVFGIELSHCRDVKVIRACEELLERLDSIHPSIQMQLQLLGEPGAACFAAIEARIRFGIVSTALEDAEFQQVLSSPHSVGRITLVMNRYQKDSNVVLLCLSALARIGCESAESCKLLGPPILTSVVGVIGAFSHRALVVSEALSVLTCIASNPDMQKMMHERRVPAATLTLMGTNRALTSLQIHGAGVLWNLSSDMESQKALVELGCVEELVKVLRIHITAQEVVRATCGALWNLTYAPLGIAKLVQSDALELIRSAMETFFQDCVLQAACCAILWNLATDDNARQLLIAANLHLRVIAALREHISEPLVQQNAAGAIWRLALRKFCNRKQVASVVPALLDSMEGCPLVEPVQRYCCKALSTLVTRKRKSVSQAISFGVADQVATAMTDFPERAELVESALTVLHTIAAGSRTELKLALPNVGELVIRAAQRLLDEPQVVKQACRVLSALVPKVPVFETGVLMEAVAKQASNSNDSELAALAAEVQAKLSTVY